MKGFDKIREMNLADIEKVSDQKGEDQNTADGEQAAPQGNNDDGKTPVKKNKKTNGIMDPQGTYYEINAKMTEGIMRNFFFGHYFRQPLMILITLMGIISLGYSFTKVCPSPGLYAMVGLCIILGYPISFLVKSKTIVKNNPLYREPFYYMIDEWGFHLKAGKECLDVEWKRFIKVRRMKTTAVLYTGKNNGYLLPYEDLGSRKEEIIAFCEKKITNNGR